MDNKTKIYLILGSGILGIFLIIIIIITLSNSIIFTLKLNCTDGTFYNNCSKDKPLYCFNGTLINNSYECGCPYDFKQLQNSCEKIKRCIDETIYSACSLKKPLYCYNGILIEKAGVCGCPYEFIEQEDKCISIYKLKPKNIKLDYVLRGKRGSIKLKVFEGLNDYLAKFSEEDYYGDSWNDFIMENLNEEKQQEYLSLLVEEIKMRADNKDDQARIAISLVQHIPYDHYAVKIDEVEFRYPYETLYDELGVCGDKSILLAFLLRELGFGVVTFEYDLEEHRAIGIKCYNKYDYQDTGYCFVETTVPSIITDSESKYEDTQVEIIYISNGTFFDAGEEYYDSIRFNDLDGSWEKEYDKYLDSEKEMGDCFEQLEEDYADLTYENYNDYLEGYEWCNDFYENYHEDYEEYEDVYDEWREIVNKYGLITED